MFWRKSRKPIPAPVTALQPPALTSLEPDWGHDDQGRKGFQLLRQKWDERPRTSQNRGFSRDVAHIASARRRLDVTNRYYSCGSKGIAMLIQGCYSDAKRKDAIL
jgi:hypothetical protein